MALLESGQMYLETILVLSRQREAVRSIDIADSMGFSRPSVSRAVNLLKDDGFLSIAKNGHITLTENGLNVAEKIYERHTLLTELFVRLGVDRETAMADACKIEHDLSDATFAALKRHAETQRIKQKNKSI